MLVERLAGDLWKADRTEGPAETRRISFRLRHGPIDQALKEMEKAFELGQHLLWQPERFPSRVGHETRGSEGRLGQIPDGRRPRRSSSSGPAALKAASDGRRLDWLRKCWAISDFDSKSAGQWGIADVWRDGAATGHDRDVQWGKILQ